ncbi:MAG TPA: hypothetical protein VJH68_05055 [Candidatus Nanoarchaeia archaeon]|nr:hypothetical protein [Candidatus Nanoarchaeia archaeon]
MKPPHLAINDKVSKEAVSQLRIFSTRNTKTIVFLCRNKIVVLFLACENFALKGGVLHPAKFFA